MFKKASPDYPTNLLSQEESAGKEAPNQLLRAAHCIESDIGKWVPRGSIELLDNRLWRLELAGLVWISTD